MIANGVGDFTAECFTGVVAEERRLGLAPDPLRRLAALRADPLSAREALRLSNDQTARLAAIHSARETDYPLAANAACFGSDAATSALALDEGSAPENWRAEIARGGVATFPVTPADVIASGVAPGPKLGRELARLKEKWLRSDLTLDRNALMR